VSARPILIVKTGSAVPSVVAEHGDFGQLIARGLGRRVEELLVVEVFQDEILPSPQRVAGVIVTGSAAMVSMPEPWAERTASWLRSTHAASVPILGICYGHQLLAWALGGSVHANPNGREIGTATVELTPDATHDRLLGGLGPTLTVQETHVESVAALPPGARLLAGNAHDPHQAFAVGESSWGVQFHPEFDAAIVRRYLEERRSIIAAEGLDPDRLLAGVADSSDGRAILETFNRLTTA
jgi:GMP synthase (glutamine-hydrolysing)